MDIDPDGKGVSYQTCWRAITSGEEVSCKALRLLCGALGVNIKSCFKSNVIEFDREAVFNTPESGEKMIKMKKGILRLVRR